MERNTVDFGIDLGTTNSSIAVFNGLGARVIKNNEGLDYTPSVIWITNKGGLYTGLHAKNKIIDDSENTASRFKRGMGDGQVFNFPGSGRKMTRVELSAEILKELLQDVKRESGEDVKSAVVCVPSNFHENQNKATQDAAKLAGISYSPLIQEPIAAALAYGFQSKRDNVFWMMYDIGGGTFDVAIIQVKDGQIQVVNNDGNNHLGGTDIDKAIVEQILVPQIKKEFRPQDFTRTNHYCKRAFAKLEQAAEASKIRLSGRESDIISIDDLDLDGRGTKVTFEYELKRKDIEPLIEPRVEESINLCLKVLADKRLSTGDIEKIILVGGPTLTPLLREMLTTRLKIPLDYSVDPLTVNACGAAILAGATRMPKDIVSKRLVIRGQILIDLEYEPIGSDVKPFICGSVKIPAGENSVDYSIEILESKTQWRSGKHKRIYH
jgi:molecular chaperone DnaK